MTRFYKLPHTDDVFYLDSMPYKYDRWKVMFDSLGNPKNKIKAATSPGSFGEFFVLYDNGDLYFSPSYTSYKSEAQLVERDVLGLFPSANQYSVSLYLSDKYKNKLFVFKKDHIVELSLVFKFDPDKKRPTHQYKRHGLDLLKDNIKETVSFSVNHMLIKTKDDRLFLLGFSIGNTLRPRLFPIPGKEWFVYNKFADDSIISVVTDEGCFLSMYTSTPFKSCGDKLISLSELPKLYRLLLPEGISPDNISQIEKGGESTLFLLTKDGRLYSIGKNTYNLRGTEDDIKPDEWNEIKYPEPIKQIEVSPGVRLSGARLFAISESGDLYVHGENFQGVSSQDTIPSPFKIISDYNIDSIQVVADDRGDDMVHIFTKDGGYYSLIDDDMRGYYKKYKTLNIVFPSIVRSVPTIRMTRRMVGILAKMNC